MRAKFVNEAKIQPDRELFNFFKNVMLGIHDAKSPDPFAELNDNLNDENVYFVDYDNYMEALPVEERKTIQGANMIPPLGVKFMGFKEGQLIIVVDKSFDDKFTRMPSRQLEEIIDRMWSGFGHETIHMGQVNKMKVKQDPTFNSQEEYFKNKQEIMAMAFSFVEEMRAFHSDEEIMDLLRTGNIQPPPPPPGMRMMPPPPGMRGFGGPPPQHPLYKTYKELGGDAWKLFVKYVYQYLQQNEE